MTFPAAFPAETRTEFERVWSYCLTDSVGPNDPTQPVNPTQPDDPSRGADPTNRGDLTGIPGAELTGIPADELDEPVEVPIEETSSATADPQTWLTQMTQTITRAAIERQAGSFLMFHAGAIANPATGQAVILVAPGGTGKTTMVRRLGRGRMYVTDETVAINEDGVIVPYPKPLSIRVSGASGKQETSPADLGLLPPLGVIRPAAYLVLDRVKGPKAAEGTTSGAKRSGDSSHRPKFTRLSTLDAIMTMVPETSSLGRLPAGLHVLADAIERVGGACQVRYREATSLSAFVDDLIGPAS